jgi:DNA repair exonuclease SbcCD ATPase subunit
MAEHDDECPVCQVQRKAPEPKKKLRDLINDALEEPMHDYDDDGRVIDPRG